MSADPSYTCPECGGHDVKDLSHLRRNTGVVLMVGSLAAVALLAGTSTPAPGWVLPVAFGVFVLGLLTVVGAHRARYCPTCNVRVEETRRE